jgi:predicted DNA-binding transcriptional regulator AlpA
MSSPISDLLTVRQVADCFDVSIRTVWRWCASRSFPRPIRPASGRVARWRSSELEDYLNRLSAQASAPP